MDNKDSQIRSHHSRPRVLVVDAEPEVAGALLEVLVYEGFEVELAENRRRAICLLGTRRPFDLMITDMKMLNGLELMRQARLPPIVLTTCRKAKNGIQFAGKASCDPVLKAYKIERLMSAIVGALRGTRIPLRTVELRVRNSLWEGIGHKGHGRVKERRAFTEKDSHYRR